MNLLKNKKKAQKTNYEVVKVDEPKDTEIKIDERLTDAQKEVAKNLIAKLDELSKNNNNAKENLDDEDKEPETKPVEEKETKSYVQIQKEKAAEKARKEVLAELEGYLMFNLPKSRTKSIDNFIL